MNLRPIGYAFLLNSVFQAILWAVALAANSPREHHMVMMVLWIIAANQQRIPE